MGACLSASGTAVSRDLPVFDAMITHKIKRGFDLRLVGQSERTLIDAPEPVLVAVQAVMKDLSRTTPELPRIAQNVGQATDSVPVLLFQTQKVMAELELLIRQLQSHWLLGGSAAKTKPTSPRISAAEVNP